MIFKIFQGSALAYQVYYASVRVSIDKLWGGVGGRSFARSWAAKLHQLRLVVYPIIYRVDDTSQMVQDFWTINSSDVFGRQT